MTGITTPATAAAPSGATTTYAYDASGNLASVTDPNAITTTYQYNPLDLISNVSYSGSSAHSVSYSYDAQGTNTAMTDATGSSSFSYSPFGEMTSSQNGAGQAISYTYDSDGNTTGITYPLPAGATWANTRTVAYGYNKQDVLTSITDFNGNQIALTPNADSAITSETLGSTGDTLSYSYSQAGDMSAIALSNATTTLQSFTYADAPSGDVLSETDVPSSSGSPAVYRYDSQNRVTSFTPGSNAARSYTFDASGNLTTSPTGASATYDKAQELTSAAYGGATTGYTYNADGERLAAKQNSTTLASASWNGAGELKSYSASAGAMTAATYDGNGLRTSATAASGTSQFTSDAASKLLMDSNNAYIYDGGTAPVEQVNLSTGTIKYLVADALGSVRGIAGSSGSLVATTSYDAWGNPQDAAGLTAYTPFGYAGGYTDADGLIYLIHRYYDPSTGQFISVDPDVSQTLSPYGYASGNPVNDTDPFGLWNIEIPTTHAPFLKEKGFENWIYNRFLNAGQLNAATQFRIKFLDPEAQFKDRIVDIYSGDFHVINEAKIGRAPASVFNLYEAIRDRYLVRTNAGPNTWCHANRNGHCDSLTPYPDVEKAIWWFGPKEGVLCQTVSALRLCPSRNMRNDLKNHSPQIHRLYVYYYNGPDNNAIENAYTHHGANLAQIIETQQDPGPGVKSLVPHTIINPEGLR